MDRITVNEDSKQIKQALRKAFPNTKFSVRGSKYSGGSSIDVTWTDGPTEAQVKEVIGDRDGASFDAMQDLKEYRYNGHDVDYVFTHRHDSPESFMVCLRAVCEFWGVDVPPVTIKDNTAWIESRDDFYPGNYGEPISRLVWREFGGRAF